MKCPVKRVLVHGDLNEALASEMMPPPPPPPPLFPFSNRFSPPTSVPSFKSIFNVANNLQNNETGCEVEFYKSELDFIKKENGVYMRIWGK